MTPTAPTPRHGTTRQRNIRYYQAILSARRTHPPTHPKQARKPRGFVPGSCVPAGKPFRTRGGDTDKEPVRTSTLAAQVCPESSGQCALFEAAPRVEAALRRFRPSPSVCMNSTARAASRLPPVPPVLPAAARACALLYPINRCSTPTTPRPVHTKNTTGTREPLPRAAPLPCTLALPLALPPRGG